MAVAFKVFILRHQDILIFLYSQILTLLVLCCWKHLYVFISLVYKLFSSFLLVLLASNKAALATCLDLLHVYAFSLKVWTHINCGRPNSLFKSKGKGGPISSLSEWFIASIFTSELSSSPFICINVILTYITISLNRISEDLFGWTVKTFRWLS